MRGDKNADGVFYGNVGIYFARHGYLALIANYRLAPAHPWPAGSQDVAGVVAWAKKEAEAHGGDATRVFLFGQSAGATHVASYLFDPQFHAAAGVGVTAGVLMSGGGYRVAANPAPNQVAYYGSDPAQYEARSPITHVGKSKVPLFLSAAEYDPGFLAAASFDLARAVASATARRRNSPSSAATTTSRRSTASAASRTTWARASGSSWAGSERGRFKVLFRRGRDRRASFDYALRAPLRMRDCGDA